MKKFLLLLLATVLFKFSALAVTTIFSESFTTSASLSTWTLINQDGKTPANGVSYVNAAWVWDNGSHFGTTCVNSTSWYNPAGQADDWLISPTITIPGGATNVLLTWKASAYSGNYPDGYQVKLATNAGNTIPDFTVNLLTVNNENASWKTRAIDLTSYAGQTIRLAWRNNSNDKWLLAVDEILLQSEVPNYNLSLTLFDAYTYEHVNSGNEFTGTVTNNGFQTITNFKANYSADGGTVTSDVISCNIDPKGSFKFFPPTQYTPTTAGQKNIKFWISDINTSNPDADHTDDTLTRKVWALSNFVNKKVLIEEFTGAWCGYCPDGHLKLEEIEAQAPYAIVAEVHEGGSSSYPDGMTTSEGNTIGSTYSEGDPTATVDRVFYLDRTTVGMSRATSTIDNLWLSKIQERVAHASPATVSILNKNYNDVSRLLTVDVRADFSADVSGDYRVNLYITEDSVTGSGDDFDQVNYYSNNSSGGSVDPTSPLAQLDDPIVGWAHMNTLRKAVGGAWGSTGVIPTNVTSGSSYTKSYSYTLNAAWKTNFIKLIAIVQEYTTSDKYRYILNTEEVSLLGNPTSVKPVSKDNFLNVDVYPNPVTDVMKVQFELSENSIVTAKVTNALGQTIDEIYSGMLNVGGHTINWNASGIANGVYFVNLKTETSEITRRVVVNK